MRAIAVILLAAGMALAADKPPAAEPSTTSRTVYYKASDVIPIPTEIRYTTIIEFPKSEKIAGAPICGDKDNWVIETEANILLVKPGEAGLQTNVNVVMESGNVYSFLVREVSKQPGTKADLKVFVKLSDDDMVAATNGKPMFVSADTVGAYKTEAQTARQELAEVRKHDQEQAAQEKQRVQQQMESGIKHDYEWDQHGKAADTFKVRAIYELNGFTIIEANPQEAPSLYEIKDGKPSLVQYTLLNGKYQCPKIIDEGFLRVGKEKLTFKRSS